MNSGSGASFLSAVFVDYDNIYLSLKRKDEDAARRFAKSTSGWLKAIESGALISPTTGGMPGGARRIVASRCYGDPVPRRNARDNSTDMNSFTFVRHHFLRAGFEIVDCPPLTAQLKNSSDIRMVMDVRDLLTHVTQFDEFIILSSDADFTPVLQRLRAHARRTVIFANEHTAQPYTALCDGEIREQDLIQFLLRETAGDAASATEVARKVEASPPVTSTAGVGDEILGLVLEAVERADRPIPLESLADRAQRTLGHERTVGSGWAGSGTFRGFLTDHLPEHVMVTEQPPYQVYVANRHNEPGACQAAGASDRVGQPSAPSKPASGYPQQPPAVEPPALRGVQSSRPSPVPNVVAPIMTQQPSALRSQSAPYMPTAEMAPVPAAPVQAQPQPMQPVAMRAAEPQQSTRGGGGWPPAQPATEMQPPKRTALNQQPVPDLQRSIARIHEACQAPPLAPPEYRLLFETIAAELKENPLDGMQTVVNIAARTQHRGLDIKRDDIRFVLDVISEADPWFDQGVSANLFAGRFRNFVVARCRSTGLALSSDELDLIDAWFAGNSAAGGQVQRAAPAHGGGRGHDGEAHSDRNWELQAGQRLGAPPFGQSGGYGGGSDMTGQEITTMPRIIRTRMPS